MKRTFVISYQAPPMVGGISGVLGTLFKYFSKGRYCFLTSSLKTAKYGLGSDIRLDCKYFHADLPSFLKSRRNRWYLSSFYELLLILITILKGTWVAYSQKIDNILATTDSGFEIAGFFIHKLTGRPFFLYIFDIYEESQSKRLQKLLAKIFEKRLLYSAVQIFVMSKSLQKHFFQKWGVRSEIIPHPVDIKNYSYSQHIKNNDEFRIVYTGMIYDAHLDSILNLVKVVNSLDHRIKFLVYTPRPHRVLSEMGISGPNVQICGFVRKSEVANIQKSADILFLPLAFNSCFPGLIRTASPSKMPEYLAAGRPILVHSPKDSYLVDYARRKGFALIVDNPDPEELRGAVIRLIYDSELRKKIVENARKTALEHDAKKVAAKLQRYLNKY